MANQLILGLTGFSGTGKTTVSNHLARKHGFELFEGSYWIKEAAKATGQTLTDRSSYEEMFREQQRQKGVSWLADMMLRSDSERVVQVGLRSKYDLLRIKQAGGAVIALECAPEICIERVDRANAKNPRTAKEYLAHQLLETSCDEFGSNTPWVVAHADYTVDTSGLEEITFSLVDSIVYELREQGRS